MKIDYRGFEIEGGLTEILVFILVIALIAALLLL